MSRKRSASGRNMLFGMLKTIVRAGRIDRSSSSPAIAAAAAWASLGGSEKISLNSSQPPLDSLWCGKTGAKTSSLHRRFSIASRCACFPLKRLGRAAERVGRSSPPRTLELSALSSSWPKAGPPTLLSSSSSSRRRPLPLLRGLYWRHNLRASSSLVPSAPWSSPESSSSESLGPPGPPAPPTRPRDTPDVPPSWRSRSRSTSISRRRRSSLSSARRTRSSCWTRARSKAMRFSRSAAGSTTSSSSIGAADPASDGARSPNNDASSSSASSTSWSGGTSAISPERRSHLKSIFLLVIL